MKKLREHPQGIDLGPMGRGIAHRLRHKDRKVHLAPEPFLAVLDEYAACVSEVPDPDALVLIGHRELRTCNPWMHNVSAVVAGRDRCVLCVHRTT
ncbi:MAG: hypothetical protein P8R42_26070 [Candidatus Binatia bacterium]|nr:hypothetical protein [Candidatus Binatia bacterium]